MAAASEWPWQSLAEAAAAVKARAVSPVELTRACLERIERVDHVVRAFVSVDAEHAVQDAQSAEREIKAGHYRGPLHGIPIGLKDNYDTTGVATRNGSRVFADRMSTQDATTWVRLQEAGAILLGKTTMSEAAWGVDFPPVRNPWDVRRNPGLSSGGSGAAVAAGLCFMAMGSDTGGSIRIPAGLSGVVGLKATYGRVSRAGVMPHTWSLDHAGPLSRRVEDAALVLGVIAWHDTYLRQPERRAKYTPEVRALMDAGTFIFATDFLKAQRLRRVLTDEVRAAFSSVDVLATPTLPLCAWEVSESHVQVDGQPEHVLHACWRFTYPWNLTGLPALSVPCGFAAELPVGLQLVGRPFDEATVLRVGHAYQEATRWHERRPPDPVGQADARLRRP